MSDILKGIGGLLSILGAVGMMCLFLIPIWSMGLDYELLSVRTAFFLLAIAATSTFVGIIIGSIGQAIENTGR